MAWFTKDYNSFFKDLEKNNNREWFQENKPRYEKAHANVIEFAEALMERMNEHDNIVPRTGKQTLFRIYRDVRFSKNKTPYKNHFSGYMSREGKQLRGGYYFHLEPGGKTMVGGGFFSPNPADLKHIRQHIEADDKPLRKIIKSATFKKYFGTLQGDTVKTAPKGFDKEHPAIDLLRHKQFYVFRTFTDKEVTSDNFLREVVKTCKAFRPFFDYMSEVLTTDLNGESLLQ